MVAFNSMFLISIAEAESSRIAATPVGQRACTFLPAVSLLTSYISWMTEVCWSCLNSLLGSSTVRSIFGVMNIKYDTSINT